MTYGVSDERGPFSPSERARIVEADTNDVLDPLLGDRFASAALDGRLSVRIAQRTSKRNIVEVYVGGKVGEESYGMSAFTPTPEHACRVLAERCMERAYDKGARGFRIQNDGATYQKNSTVAYNPLSPELEETVRKTLAETLKKLEKQSNKK